MTQRNFNGPVDIQGPVSDGLAGGFLRAGGHDDVA